MPTIDVEDVRLWFTDSGDVAGERPPILLVHGWTCDSHDWSFQLDVFEALHRVVAVDLRGHGRSSAPERGYSMRRYADDLAGLLQQLSIAKVVAIGHSLGASVVAALAVEHPDLVLATVSVEPAYGQPEAMVAQMREAAMLFGDLDGNALAASLLAATEPLIPPWLRTWHRRRALGMDPGLLKQTFWELYFSDTQISAQPRSDAYLADRRCPNLAFHRLPPMADWERGVMSDPASRVICWEGSGHWLHQERAPEFNALVLSWIEQLTQPAPGAPVDLSPADPPQSRADRPTPAKEAPV